LENCVIFVVIFGVLALYFFSTFNLFRALYKKKKEEQVLTIKEKKDLENKINIYEKQLQSALEAIKDTEELLEKARDEIQRLKIRNSELRHRNELLQRRVDELYSSIGII